jgi:hypothetical protein
MALDSQQKKLWHIPDTIEKNPVWTETQHENNLSLEAIHYLEKIQTMVASKRYSPNTIATTLRP